MRCSVSLVDMVVVGAGRRRGSARGRFWVWATGSCSCSSRLLPTIVVRAARRARVRAVEQDLPLVLELFATMGEAGLGFDAALAKVIRARAPSGR